ncbi:MAG: hypothetical protein JRF63_00335 [Deltaproteobacteria bacterium]|nr:hypothetical protein [Deltaproteobacteria bacterium]
MRPVLLLFGLLLACDRTPPPRTAPESAFSRIAACVDDGGASCLFRELDRDSRWSTASIQRSLAEMRLLVERSYPENLRATAYGAWAAESVAIDAAELFGTFCAKRGCMKQLARGFGAVVRVPNLTDAAATIETTRGARFQMACVEGEWGLATFREELEQAKIHLGDTLQQIHRNAKAYEEQKIVNGEGGNAK